MMGRESFLRNRFLILGSLLLLLCSALFLFFYLADRFVEGIGPGVVQVVRQDMRLEVVERGVIRPAVISPVSSQISSNQAKIVWLIPEGSRVQKGMLVARFDTKPFSDRLLKVEQAYADASATLGASEKMLSLQKEEEAGRIEEALRKVEIAGIEATNIREGSGPLQRKVLEQQLHQAERALAIGRKELQDLELLVQKGHVSSREKEKAQDKVRTAEELGEVARAERDNFDLFSWPKMLREAELLVSAAQSNLARVKRTAELQIQNREAEMAKNRRLLLSKQKDLERAQRDIENCNLYAPTDGILLHSVLPRENGRRKIQIGDSVWVGQTFLEVPDTTELVAEIGVREIDVARVKNGMVADMQVDAFPGKRFSGVVSAIASLAGEDGNVGLRRFPCRVALDGEVGDLHVGMSISVTILSKRIDRALVVPVNAVIYRKSGTFVEKFDNKKSREVEVDLGKRGPHLIEVIGGLAENDMVLLQKNQG